MAGSRRASMREGPLAALFRRTDEDAPADAVAADAAESAAAAERAAAPEPSAPHPSLLASTEASAAEEPEIAPPTPQERLRAAFSSDIPENMLEAPPSLQRADYTRDEASSARRHGQHGPVLRVVGVGGAGVNAVNRMIEAEVAGVEFIAVNTDQQSLQQSSAHLTVSIGESLTRGLGSGSDPVARPSCRDGGVRPRQVAAQGLRHDLHHGRRRRRHRHGRGARRRADRARGRCADCRAS